MVAPKNTKRTQDPQKSWRFGAREATNEPEAYRYPAGPRYAHGVGPGQRADPARPRLPLASQVANLAVRSWWAAHQPASVLVDVVAQDPDDADQLPVEMTIEQLELLRSSLRDQRVQIQRHAVLPCLANHGSHRPEAHSPRDRNGDRCDGTTAVLWSYRFG
jgi:hypothetical protein